eukprot:TRINITY_DN660_c0_g1_i5.p1 TRINITY_DN660_c0_g1~~TRINITY_DN660_c0_g1_i5.p1  ORF type:complete len:250 (+),score=88.26 TRINITY_DN660_c0_g1_i5:239-988(+)
MSCCLMLHQSLPSRSAGRSTGRRASRCTRIAAGRLRAAARRVGGREAELLVLLPLSLLAEPVAEAEPEAEFVPLRVDEPLLDAAPVAAEPLCWPPLTLVDPVTPAEPALEDEPVGALEPDSLLLDEPDSLLLDEPDAELLPDACVLLLAELVAAEPEPEAELLPLLLAEPVGEAEPEAEFVPLTDDDPLVDAAPVAAEPLCWPPLTLVDPVTPAEPAEDDKVGALEPDALTVPLLLDDAVALRTSRARC